MGFCGLWTAAFIAVVVSLPEVTGLLLRNLLAFLVFYQALVSLVAATIGWGPRDIAFGMISRDFYLTNGFEPKGIHYPIRKDLERRVPRRNGVYVYGDDTSYYLSGRVFVDYELGSDPLLWRLAADSWDSPHLRRKVRQRRWSHMLYSTRWPEYLESLGRETFRHNARTVGLMSEFWRRYAVPLLVREAQEGRRHGAYVFELSRLPREGAYDPDFSNRLPMLPGAIGLTWKGDQALLSDDARRAFEYYRERLEQFPRCAILHDRMARAEVAAGHLFAAREHFHNMQRLGWMSPKLRALVGTAAGE